MPKSKHTTAKKDVFIPYDPSASARKQNRRKIPEILDSVAELVNNANMSYGAFLHEFFRDDIDLDTPHGHKLRSFLTGQTSYNCADTVGMIWNHRYSHPGERTHENRGDYFSRSKSPKDIKFAGPAISTWCLRRVAEEAEHEAKCLCSREVAARRGRGRPRKARASGKRAAASEDMQQAGPSKPLTDVRNEPSGSDNDNIHVGDWGVLECVPEPLPLAECQEDQS
ncbi:hypothetical protein BC834DRAFT_968683 [Gloeopeniophorella convolvens]|nr:hypothetical protein BC834DRAFT_968683 [Gloeopeniophorella convolvens]